MRGNPVDRLPMVEWVFYWEPTLERWGREGLPGSLVDNALKDISASADLHEYFGLARMQLTYLEPFEEAPPRPRGEGTPCFGGSLGGYEELRPSLFPEALVNEAELLRRAEAQASRDTITGLCIWGFFWGPRYLMGIAEHLYGFYDEPELMHRITRDLLDYNLGAIDRACRILKPEYFHILEDISGKQGPMISGAAFEEFLAPYYRILMPELKKYGIPVLIDTDGAIDPLTPWYLDVGADGYLPMERQAGVDPVLLSRGNPGLRMIGGFDKRVIGEGEDAVRSEFERLLPAIRSGGYIPSVDHQAPPDASLENYRTYVRLLGEYCKAGGTTS
jgi:hypothetical protein